MFARNLAFLAFAAIPALGLALDVTVAPATGVAGTPVTNTIEDAITQINAAGDIGNQITLRGTEGPHFLPPDTTWSIAAGKNLAFFPETDAPAIVVLNSIGTRYMLTIAAGTSAPNQSEFVTFNDIIFIPQLALTYVNNIADGINLAAGGYEFNDCIFTSNDGSNGPASLEGDVEYSSTGHNVGDDWIQMNTPNMLIFNNCTITGAHDDGILMGGATAPDIASLFVGMGTCIANNGGAGIQVFGDRVALTVDGSSRRVMIADNGKRSPNDVGIKIFGDEASSVDIDSVDIIGNTHSGFFDFSGVPTISISNTRFAFNNSTNQDKGAHFAVWETDLTPDSGMTNQQITFTNVTMHDVVSLSVPNGIDVEDDPNTPLQTYIITDSIFSGAGDVYTEMTNSLAAGGPSPDPAVSFTAVVDSGPHALANPGELGVGQVQADPEYVSLDYTIGRGEENPDFLLPTNSVYAGASSTGQFLRGGAPEPQSGVHDFMLY